MFGNIDKQVSRLIRESEILKLGVSKHEAREKIIQNGANNSHQIAKNSAIHSIKHFKNSESTWRQFANSLKEHKIKDLEKASNRAIERFLEKKIEAGISSKHFQNVCSHLTKLESMLNSYADKNNTGNTYDFDKKIERYKEIAKIELDSKAEARAYEKPQDLVDNIQRDDYRLSASIQLEAGARLREAGLIDRERLAGITEKGGVISLKAGDTKGGKERDLHVSKETYLKLEKYINENGKLKIDDPRAYRDAIKQASNVTNQNYTGSHGLRHTYAQNRMNELQTEGVGYRTACLIVSREMGHERPSITELYLR